MPTLVFDGNELGLPAAAEIEHGGRLLDACDAVHAPVAFSCRSARCGICRVEVVSGADLLAPPASDELEVLAFFHRGRGSAFAVPFKAAQGSGLPSGAPLSHRLACQAIVRPGPGLIRLRWVNRAT